MMTRRSPGYAYVTFQQPADGPGDPELILSCGSCQDKIPSEGICSLSGHTYNTSGQLQQDQVLSK